MKKIYVVIGCLMFLQAASYAAPIATATWGAGLENWTATNAPTPSAPPYGALNNPGGYLRITGGAASGAVKTDYIYDATTLAGDTDYTTYGGGVASVRFDFYANADAGGEAEGETRPSDMYLYLYSSTTGARWVYLFDSIVSGWGLYYANMSATGWQDLESTGTTFAQSLIDVDQIGIMLVYLSDAGGQIYGLDDFELNDTPVPEPSTYAFLGFAFVSLAITFRRKLNDSLAKVVSYRV